MLQLTQEFHYLIVEYLQGNDIINLSSTCRYFFKFLLPIRNLEYCVLFAIAWPSLVQPIFPRNDEYQLLECFKELKRRRFKFKSICLQLLGDCRIVDYLPSTNHLEIDLCYQTNRNMEEFVHLKSLNRIAVFNSYSTAHHVVKSLPNFRYLKSLKLMDISGLDLEPLAKHLSQTNLTRLEFYSVTIVNLLHLMVSLCFSTVNVLELVNADLGDADALIIAKSLSKTKLTVLTLNRNRIGTKGAIDLSKSLKYSSLQYLGLGENPIGTEGCKAIVQAIVQSSFKQYDLEKTNSTEIDFNCLKIENLVNAQITSISIDCYNSKVFDAVCQNIKHVQNDFRLKIRNFQLALIFKEAQCSNIKSLSIDASCTNNGNSLLGIESYLGLSNIQRICITEAIILPAFLGNLLSNLSNHSPLQYLEITGRATSANTQQGMIDFAKHLPNTNLKHLALNKLDFSDFSLQQLSKSINQTRLRTLDLSGNRFSRNGIVQFVNTVKYSSIYKLSFIQQSSSTDIKMIRNSFVDMLGDRRGLQVVL